jgi:hypothetical protein
MRKCEDDQRSSNACLFVLQLHKKKERKDDELHTFVLSTTS